MPSRVLLISLNRCSNPDPVFPIGLSYLNSILRRAGHEVKWYDVLADSTSLDSVLSEFRPTVTGISVRNVDDVLLRRQEVYFLELESVCSMVRRETRCPVVLGGSGFSLFPEELLRNAGADYGICGAGEVSFLRLLEALSDGEDVSNIPGLVYHRNGRVFVNPARPEMPALPLTEADRPAGVAAHYLRASGTLNVQTQRGCSFKCCYCAYPLLEGRSHLRRPAEEIAAEFELAQRTGARFVFVVDSVFNSSPRHTQEVCEAIIRRNVQISWGCFLRPQGLSVEQVKLMKRAGLSHVEFGSDSFCDEVLQAYQKGFSFDDVRQSNDLVRQAKIECCHFVICGGPGETRKTLEQSYQNSLLLGGAVILAVVGMRIYPGTPLFCRAQAEGHLNGYPNLLEPIYYISRDFEQTEQVFDHVRCYSRQSPNWIVGDPSPAFISMVARLRQRGVVGPLWSYAAMVQRLWPGGWTTSP